MLDIKQLLWDGIAVSIAENEGLESLKTGTLRGGNSGIITADGIVTGACPRLTYLRMKGISVNPIDKNRELMFHAGRSNEDGWVESLSRSYSGPILTEEDVPTKWFTDNGTPVTGRPDIVLCDYRPEFSMDGIKAMVKGGKPLADFAIPRHGLELKLVSSVWTARDILVTDIPKMNHLIQAAHYSMALDIPFDLWYTCRADFAVGSGWEQNVFKKGKDIPEMEISKDGSVKKITPFARGYSLSWDANGRLSYRSLASNKQTETIITKDSIRLFYNTVAEVDQTGILPKKVVGLKGNGQSSYNPCDFCVLKQTCSNSKLSLTEFNQAAVNITGGKQ